MKPGHYVVSTSGHILKIVEFFGNKWWGIGWECPLNRENFDVIVGPLNLEELCQTLQE